MRDERNQNREACPESLLQGVAAELQQPVSELYRGLWRISFGRERRADEQEKQLLGVVNAAAKALAELRGFDRKANDSPGAGRWGAKGLRTPRGADRV
jgi:hypothetical protein